MAVIWETTDRLGRPVVLTDSAWEHVLNEHSDFDIEQQDLRDTIERAEEIVRDRSFRHRQIHYRRYKSGPLWFRVVVHYSPDEVHSWVGRVITAHPIRKRNESEVLLWPSSKQS